MPLYWVFRDGYIRWLFLKLHTRNITDANKKETSPLNLRIIRLSRGARCSNATVSGAVQTCGAEGEEGNKSRGSFVLYRRLTSATRDVTCSTSLRSHLHFVNVIWKSTLPMFNISTTEIAAGLRLEHLLDSRLYMVSVFFPFRNPSSFFSSNQFKLATQGMLIPT